MYHLDFSHADRHISNKETKKNLLMLDAIISKNAQKWEESSF